ncbi:MAG: PLP-dependent aminotransferase family protein, partial [Defluviitaleaceae bacterium]|nr:PLP-dependent aminotransferase family protein [Defluviitaleaceae bacterium]
MKNTNIFSNRITQLESTAVSEMLKHISSPNVIPFAAGNPSPEAFPKEIIAEIATEILNKNPITALQYGKTEGYLPLRESLVDFLGSDFNADNAILITSGATQGIELITKTFTNEGDLVICENPTFIGTLNAFRSYNLDVKGIPMESDGINIQALENALKEAKEKGKNVRFIYTIPNFQNPSGATLSLQKRESMYRLALEHNVLILEDDPYGDLRYFGEHIPSIKSMDTKGIVLYAGSFSNIISPGLRVGYLVVHERFFEKLTAAKQVSDVHNPLLCQMIIHEFMKRHGLDNHIAEIRKIYKRKLTLTL